ncbi:hypothetical protein GJAV_G00127600 [Gymnothorax javanicus]|nr:hypothetical protein GJAV_G00127600 [Gymnothorax javanicus]
MERVCAAIGIIFLQVVCHLSAEEEILMYTKTETSDLKWTIHPRINPQWEEVSGLDEDNNIVRTYQICPSSDGAGSVGSHWLRSTLIQRRGAWQAYVELRFTMMECSSLPNLQRTCKETFNLLYYQADSDEATPNHPPWMENPYVKVDTVAADFLLRKGGERKFNVKTLRLGPLTAAGFYLAFQAQGACMALLSVRVFFKKCPATLRAFTSFPETVPRALVQEAQGVCVPNAAQRPAKMATSSVASPPRMFCGEDGQWVGQPTSTCTCLPGYQPVAADTGCKECPVGQFKSSVGAGQCSLCPANSHSASIGASSCACRPGFLRASADTPDTPCTKPPSAPRSIVTQVNDTSVTLEWSEPLDSGGRRDLTYAVVCLLCGPLAAPWALWGQCELQAVAGGSAGAAGDRLGPAAAHHLQLQRAGPQRGLPAQRQGAGQRGRQRHHQPRRASAGVGDSAGESYREQPYSALESPRATALRHPAVPATLLREGKAGFGAAVSV